MEHPTMGIEEEYFVIDVNTREVVPYAEAVVRAAEPVFAERVTGEITQQQVEARTHPCTKLGELRELMRGMHAAVAQAATATGVAVVASGTPVLALIIRESGRGGFSTLRC
jgi:carboxylate-amine ligase